ncbi:ATP-binding protein [Paenibacillus sp. LHD-117]|uniref:ATP-binding protein n=1 Tax=Paenibacillus sp. LHD-117 TaxID=3071412 RepID=UPI0027DFB9A5|nr:ATP-binding protein [Paenibacillus sp. LHD-117]MDQ6422171.1 ATP-binding protein [Paenibacillus sp. LHD-117]
MVKKLVNAHGGQVWVESREGTMIYIRLPKGKHYRAHLIPIPRNKSNKLYVFVEESFRQHVLNITCLLIGYDIS